MAKGRRRGQNFLDSASQADEKVGLIPKAAALSPQRLLIKKSSAFAFPPICRCHFESEREERKENLALQNDEGRGGDLLKCHKKDMQRGERERRRGVDLKDEPYLGTGIVRQFIFVALWPGEEEGFAQIGPFSEHIVPFKMLKFGEIQRQHQHSLFFKKYHLNRLPLKNRHQKNF